MIRFEPVPEPTRFDREVRLPGEAWLAANPEPVRPKDFWTPFKGALADGFRNLCAYSAMYEPVGTVDHFVSCHEDRSRGASQIVGACPCWVVPRFSPGGQSQGFRPNPEERE